MKSQVLVVEGNARATSDVMESLGGTPYGVSYAALLESLHPGVECTVVYPSEDGSECLPEGKSFEDYDGIVWTGSALNCYNTEPEVTNQIEMAKTAFASGTPIFGSCWGLQVMTLALGGKVRCNPKGRELGIGREITLTAEGAAHPMYSGKSGAFDVFEVHMDEVERLPEGAVVLAGNAMSDVQAVVMDRGDCSFWGVQYHPEFDFATMAIVMQRLTETILTEGLFESRESIEAIVRDYEVLDGDDSLVEAHGVTAAVQDSRLRRLEISNWLREKVVS